MIKIICKLNNIIQNQYYSQISNRINSNPTVHKTSQNRMSIAPVMPVDSKEHTRDNFVDNFNQENDYMYTSRMIKLEYDFIVSMNLQIQAFDES